MRQPGKGSDNVVIELRATLETKPTPGERGGGRGRERGRGGRGGRGGEGGGEEEGGSEAGFASAGSRRHNVIYRIMVYKITTPRCCISVRDERGELRTLITAQP